MAEVKYLTGTKEYKVFLSPIEHAHIVRLLQSTAVFEQPDEQLIREDLLHSFTHFEKF